MIGCKAQNLLKMSECSVDVVLIVQTHATNINCVGILLIDVQNVAEIKYGDLKKHTLKTRI